MMEDCRKVSCKSSPARPCSPRRRLLHAKSFDIAISGTIGDQFSSFVHLKLLKHSLWLVQGIYGERPPLFSNPNAAVAWWERLRLVRAASLALFHEGTLIFERDNGSFQKGKDLMYGVLKGFSTQREKLNLEVGDRVIFFRTGAWHPALVTGANNDGDGYKLNFEGCEAFDRLWVQAWDPRLRKEEYFDPQVDSRSFFQKGYFPKIGNHVELSIVDCLERCFYVDLNARPVGVVVDSAPGKDMVLVELVKPCGTEKVFTRNTNITIISDEKYEKEAEKILNFRYNAIEWLRCAVVLETPFSLGSLISKISNQRALVSYTVHQNRLNVSVLDVLGMRRLQLSLKEKDILGYLGNISLRNSVNCSIEWRLALCLRITQCLRVIKGALKFVDDSFQEPNTSYQMMETFYTLKTVRVKIKFQRAGAGILVSVLPVFKDIGKIPDYNMYIAPEDWSFLEYGRLDWLLPEQKEMLCNDLLSLIQIKIGYPVLQLRSSEVKCKEFSYFEPPKKEKPDYDDLLRANTYNQVFWASKRGQNDHRVFWRRVKVLKDYSIESSGRYFVTAQLGEDGNSLNFQFVHMTGRSSRLKMGFRDYAKYHYGPMAWMTKEQKEFLCEMVCYWVAVNPENGECKLDTEIVRKEFSKRDFILRWFGERRRISICDHGFCLKIKATAKGVPGDWEFEVHRESWEEHTRIKDLQWEPVAKRAWLAQRMIWQVVLESGPPKAYVDCTIPVLFWRAGCNILRKGRCFVGAYDAGRSVVILVKDCNGHQINMTHVTPEDWVEVMGTKMTPFFWQSGKIRPCVSPEPLAEHVIELAKIGVISLSERFYKKRIEEKIWTIEREAAPPEYPIFDVGFKLPPKEDNLGKTKKRFAMIRQMSKLAAEGSAAPPKRMIFRPSEFASDWSDEEIAEDLVCQCCGLERGEGHGKYCEHKFGVCRPCKIRTSRNQRKVKTEKRLHAIKMEKESEALERQLIEIEDQISLLYRQELQNQKSERFLLAEEDTLSSIIRISDKFGCHFKDTVPVKPMQEFDILPFKPQRVATLSIEACENIFMRLEDKTPQYYEEQSDEDDDEFYCDICRDQIDIYNDGRFNCPICEDYDLCKDCLAFLTESHGNGIFFHQPSHCFVHLISRSKQASRMLLKPLSISVLSVPEKFKPFFKDHEMDLNKQRIRRRSIATGSSKIFGFQMPFKEIGPDVSGQQQDISLFAQRSRTRSLPTTTNELLPLKDIIATNDLIPGHSLQASFELPFAPVS